MIWSVLFHDEFESEFDTMTEDVQDNLLAAARAVQIAGPKAGRPHVDTLAGSKHANMKELRFIAHGGREVWRAFFAFDPDRVAIVLVAGDKQGKNQKLFVSIQCERKVKNLPHPALRATLSRGARVYSPLPPGEGLGVREDVDFVAHTE